jgi:RND family efflux transporter MFP subunit
MKTASKSIWLIMGLLALFGCSGNGHAPEKKAAAAVIVKGAVTERVDLSQLPETFEVVGTVRSRTSAVITSRVPGTISAIKGQEGDRVKKGQLLIQLDAGENQANEAAAVAGIDEARRGLDEAVARKRLADVTHERYQKLFNEQAVTRQEFDIKQADKEIAAQGVSRAEARLRQAQAGAQAAGSLSGYTRISAPISGVITAKAVGLGATVFPSQPLMTIEDEGGYQLELAIPESMSSKVRPGNEVQITLDAIAATASARIAEVVPSSDPLSRTFIAKVSLGQKGLKSGMFGRGVISLGGGVSGMLVAKTAVFERGALTSVWTVDKDSIAHMRIVKTGRTVGGRVEILSGLSSGERVVVSGAEKVSEGSRVE